MCGINWDGMAFSVPEGIGTGFGFSVSTGSGWDWGWFFSQIWDRDGMGFDWDMSISLIPGITSQIPSFSQIIVFFGIQSGSSITLP